MSLESLREDARFWRQEHPAPTPAHYHPCPTCYEYEACTMACTVDAAFNDLGEHKGCPVASHTQCSTCCKAGVPNP